MIRRVISILIALAGAGLLYSWWQRGHEPPAPTLSPIATVLEDVGLAGDDEADAGIPGAPDSPDAEPEEPASSTDLAAGADGTEAESSAPSSVTAGWAPTRVDYDPQDRNAVLALLQRADAALAAGQLITPAGQSAVDLYFTALEAAPGNIRARQGLDQALDRVAAMVTNALEGGNYPAAADLLPVLEQLRAEAPETLRQRERLEAAEPQRLALQRAARALERGALDEGRRNALRYFRQVLEAEPGNATAAAGVAAVQARLVAEAMKLAAAGDFEQADERVGRAAAIDPDALQVLVDARAAVAGYRSQAATALLRDAHARLDAADADAAETLLEQALGVDPDSGGAGLVRERIRNVRLYGGYAEGERFQDSLASGGEGPAMIVVPVGSFLMGSPSSEDGRRANEGPQFRVRIDRGFALAETELTVADFRRFVAATGHRTRAEDVGTASVYDERSGSMRDRRGVTWRDDESGEMAADEQPVVHVSWNDAAAYARWLAVETSQPYRLPSEAEFEYALRAASSSRYPWGDGPPERPLANVSTAGDRSRSRREWSNAFPGTTDGWFGIAPVRSFPANAFGLHDMPGNVSEWVEDCWHSTYARAPSNGRAWVNPGCGNRVVRGGSWASGPEQVRSAYRLSITSATTSPRVGFRVARDLQ